MQIYLNETPIKVKKHTCLFELRKQYKENADLLIVNGYPANTDQEINNGDHVIMIQRGEQPSAEELEILMMARHTPGVMKKSNGAVSELPEPEDLVLMLLLPWQGSVLDS